MTVSESVAAYVAAQTAINDQQDAAIDAITTSFNGVAGDVKFLTDALAAINNSPGTLSPEDQATLDAALVRGQSTVTKLTGIQTALSDLDSLTNPTPPPVETSARGR